MTDILVEQEPGTAPPKVASPKIIKRIRPREFKPSDVLILLLSIAASFSILWIIFAQLTLLNGALGFVMLWIPTFLFLYWFVNRQMFTRQVAVDRLIGALVTLGAGIMMLPLVLLTIFVFQRGLPLLSWSVLTHTQQGVVYTSTTGNNIGGVNKLASGGYRTNNNGFALQPTTSECHQPNASAVLNLPRCHLLISSLRRPLLLSTPRQTRVPHCSRRSQSSPVVAAARPRPTAQVRGRALGRGGSGSWAPERRTQACTCCNPARASEGQASEGRIARGPDSGRCWIALMSSLECLNWQSGSCCPGREEVNRRVSDSLQSTMQHRCDAHCRPPSWRSSGTQAFGCCRTGAKIRSRSPSYKGPASSGGTQSADATRRGTCEKNMV